MSDLLFNEESYYSEETKSENEDLHSANFQPFQFEHKQKKKCGNENHQEDTKHIHALVADLLHNRIGNLDWCLENSLSLLSRGGCNAYFLDENLGAQGKHLAIQLLWATAQLLVTRVSLI